MGNPYGYQTFTADGIDSLLGNMVRPVQNYHAVVGGLAE